MLKEGVVAMRRGKLLLLLVVCSAVQLFPLSAGRAAAARMRRCWMPRAAEPSAPLEWQRDYGKAWSEAARRNKWLLIWFESGPSLREQREVERAFGSNTSIRKLLKDYVLLRLPVRAEISVAGRSTRLLAHPAFEHMHGRSGLAIVDLTSRSGQTYGHVVSAFPFMHSKYYRFQARDLPVMLTLPPGTITERTMIWAVRTHPEQPASTQGVKHAELAAEARRHSRYQARLGIQGHHRWGFRFQRLRALLGGGRGPVEVVAESWPGQTMIDSCVDCVESWRQSPGHWSAVRQPHSLYGYDIQQGSNGIWYGTGVFAN
jgi:hypothetical protein